MSQQEVLRQDRINRKILEELEYWWQPMPSVAYYEELLDAAIEAEEIEACPSSAQLVELRKALRQCVEELEACQLSPFVLTPLGLASVITEGKKALGD